MQARAAQDYTHDLRPVATLDAGGTKLSFSVLRGGRVVAPPLELPTPGDDLTCCLGTIVRGIHEAIGRAGVAPVALSFAFPGPADYPSGVIGDLYNLPAFRGGVALGPMLAERFGVPVFISNDGDLFAYGEALGGLLPHVNELLARAHLSQRYRNLVGVTLGTGFGGGVVVDGRPLLGDNSAGAEVWLLRATGEADAFAEEQLSRRAVVRAYGDAELSPKELHEIALGQRPGDRAAALGAFATLGVNLGQALATLATLVDGLIVVGGGLSAAHRLFLPQAVEQMNRPYSSRGGATRVPRLEGQVFDLESAPSLATFLTPTDREVTVPFSSRKVAYRCEKRIGVGVTRLGTSTAVALGAYAFALTQLDSTGSSATP